MARIRSVHPGFFTDEAIVSVSMAARICIIGLGIESDDKGIFEWKPLMLKMRLFPADNINMEVLLGELLAADLIQQYSVGGKPYGAIRNFRKFQKPKTPNDIHPTIPEIRNYIGLSPAPSEEDEVKEGQFPPKGEKSPQMEEGGGNSSSVPIGTGDGAPSLSPADITKAIWDSGKAILKAAGHDDRQAGSIIGRFRKTYSDSQVLTVLSRCQTEQPSEPVEWITKSLQAEARQASGQANARFQPTHGSSTRELAEQVAAELAAPH